ncbi:hypothetical protein [Clostridium perfringens]|uniref:Uncharacterized protein n=3 Tax=Clostridium perfringens TaxID=1502 RepID=A0AAW9IQX6_CLOPF|nr:hypothetical protein [Clostridium perfringens]ELC8401146.1 hypothetical protein [Clostridium perfringens]MBI5982843.1 hypothetical protein [Clostridium perfringens]MBI6041375.1 hypothetical protein [Clostridium perfringens]MBI6071365.1 hypothetical protein [Clostridium perfringens]MBI6079286.1 hypothetical protein [Clostridium perfringens]
MANELKQFVEDKVFIEKMNSAFAALRADYELDLDTSKEKINELKSVNVDNKNHLSNLVSYSTKSSGTISGLRGTGKTHLFLLARNDINENIDKNKAVAIYLNVKRLHLPQEFTQEIFNRAFSIFLYNELSKQLTTIIYDLQDDTFLKKVQALFKSNNAKLIRNIEKAIIKINIFKAVIRSGSQEFSNLERGQIKGEEETKELIELKNKIAEKLRIKDTGLSMELEMKAINEVQKNISTNNEYLKYLNIQDVRDEIMSILKMLQIKTITFYVDEWEKLYYNEKAQEYLAFYIDRMIDTPIYFWIGIVPKRGSLYTLDNGADLQHMINLDDSLIFENSKYDKELCMNYFKEFINKRLYFYLKDYNIDYTILFNKDKKLEQLVLASMGNSRDFGTMLLGCWSEFQSYKTKAITTGRPFKYISEDMIAKAIKNDGDKKLSNIKDDSDVMKVWNDLHEYCSDKKSSHFSVEESKENTEAMSNKLFSELIYHRLLHFRKGHVPPKEKKIINKLSIYALSFSCTYDSHKRDKRFEFITDYDVIHDRVRRYIYKPNEIIKTLKIKDGEIAPCKSCGESINVLRMRGAWETNTCPFCGQQIHN